ncbi:OmpA family protein [Marinicellulosiphila megalodicopiae]|uniref:OmpA family protein n=1 Tax=Marinicellulosiphila megalodicopiae TaxID=2724896 RepID=UPI003BB1FE45
MKSTVNFNSKLLQFAKHSLVTALVAATATSAYSIDFNASQGTSTAYLAQTNLVDNQFSINLSINDNDSIPGMWVVLKSPQTGDILSFTEQHGVTGVFETDNVDAYILKLSGIATAAQYQEIARTVSLRSSVSGARKVDFVFDDNNPDTLYNIYNSHYYLYVRPEGYDAEGLDDINITWQEANIDANTKTYFGLQGYLVTIGDDHENTFVYSKIDDNTWMGASDDPATINELTGLTTVEDHWYWVTGPEKGTQFWQGKSVTHTGSDQGFPVNNQYSNWDEVDDQEPNNYQNLNESFAHFFAKDENLGNWNDVPNTSGYYKVKGYLVEFGGLDVDSTSLVSTKQVIVETNQAPSIAVTLGELIVEGSASENQQIATFTASDIEDATAPTSDFKTNSNTENYYLISGLNILLTQLGADFVNAGGVLPAIILTATDSENSSTDSTPVTPMSDFNNDAPVISVTLGADVVEHSAMDYQVVATFSATDEEDGTPAITFESNSNASAYYEILGSNVVLSQLGATAVNAGNALPEIQLTATDSQNLATDSNAVTPVTMLINDSPEITLTLGSDIVENLATKDQIVASFVATDEEDGTPAVTFASNTDMYYTITGSDVVLTQAGADVVNAGGTLPSITLLATDSDSEATTSNSVTPVNASTNDAPEITLTLGSDVVENSASKEQVVASFVATDEEDGTPAVTFVSNTDMYYMITGSDVLLTQAGADAANAGNSLPLFALTATDIENSSSTSSSVTPVITPTNDAPEITLTLGASVTENSAAMDQVVATFVATDEEDIMPSVTFASNADMYYMISGSNIVLTQIGADAVNAGGILPAITLVATDSESESMNSNSVTPLITPTNDAPAISLTSDASVDEESASKDQVIATFVATDEEDGTPVVAFESPNDYFVIVEMSVVLTQMGADFVNAGNSLPSITLTATDSDDLETTSNTVTPITSLLNDAPVITITLGDNVVENSASVDQVVATFVATDEEDITPSVTFASNADMYYMISGSNVVLTQKGADSVNAGEVLPSITLIATDSDAKSVDSNTVMPNTTLVNAAPVITLILGSNIDARTVKGQVISSFVTSDEEDENAPMVEFKTNSNTNDYYAISSMNIVLTQAGADFVNTGGSLPAITLTATDTDNAKTNSAPVTPIIGDFIDTDMDGILDSIEGEGDSDGDGIPNNLDIDSDNDGINDSEETANDFDEDGIANYLDLDSDNDSIPDAIEGNVNSDDDDQPNYLDLDSDNDGLPDFVEQNIFFIDEDQDGITDQLDTSFVDGVDANNDGQIDDIVLIDTDSDSIPDYIDPDSDNDGIYDSLESDLLDENGALKDADNDGIADAFDIDEHTDSVDLNNDGIADNAMALDTDSDGKPNYVDLDSDNDSLSDLREAVGFPSSLDLNENGVADQLDTHITNPIDTDEDGLADYIDVDSNNDGVFDIESTIFANQDADKNGSVDSLLDEDNDGIMDVVDYEPTIYGNLKDQDGDGIINSLDPDDDNDGISDVKESEGGNDQDSDNDGLPDRLDTDSNNDGILDQVEAGLPEPTGSDEDQDGIDDAYDADMPGAIDLDQDGFADFVNPTPAPAPELDSDNDGIPDSQESYNLPPLGNDTDTDGIDDRYDVDQTGGKDANNDGIDDDLVANNDVDGDGTPNYLDVDSDGDGHLDSIENGDYNEDGVSDYLQPEESLTTGIRGAGSLSPALILAMLSLMFGRILRLKKVVVAVFASMVSMFSMSAQTADMSADMNKPEVSNFTVCHKHDPSMLDNLGDSAEQPSALNCVYGGLGLGMSLLYPDDEISSWKVESHASTAINGLVGWRFSPRYFTELHLHGLGNAKIEHINPNITNEERLKYSAISLHLGGYLFDINKEREMKFNPFAKVGIASLSSKASDNIVPVEQKNNIQLALSIGVQKQLNKSWFARFNVEGFDKDAKSLSLSIQRYIGSTVIVDNSEVEQTMIQPEPVVEEVIEEDVVEVAVLPVIPKTYCKEVPDGLELDENGCPILHNALVSIYFDFDDGSLNQTAIEITDKIIAFMKANPDYVFEIQGNTDLEGTVEYNKGLSLKRAQNTLDYLVEQGIKKERLTIIAFGESLPIVNAENQYLSDDKLRRADFVILKKIDYYSDVDAPKQED